MKAEINKKMDATKDQYAEVLAKDKKGEFLTEQEKEQLTAYNKKVENYQRLGVLLDVVASGLSAPTNSGLGIATSSLSPVASYEIGQYFKAKGTEGSSAHILAHTVLGAAVAAAGGNDALTAGLTAGGAEAAAPVLSNFLFGKRASDLTAEEKSTISAITGLVATGIGGAASGDIASAVQSGQGAQNAVENNNVADSRNASALGKTQAQMAKEYVDAERKRSCGAVGLSANSEACNRHLRKGTSDTLGNLSEGATVAGLYPTPASPYLLGGGAVLGAASTLLDDEKSNYQKGAEIAFSTLGGFAGGQLVKRVKTPDGDRLYSETVERIFSETSGKIAEKVPGAIKECNNAKEPKPIGCGK